MAVERSGIARAMTNKASSIRETKLTVARTISENIDSETDFYIWFRVSFDNTGLTISETKAEIING